jgi:hypothetical protein
MCKVCIWTLHNNGETGLSMNLGHKGIMNNRKP